MFIFALWTRTHTQTHTQTQTHTHTRTHTHTHTHTRTHTHTDTHTIMVRAEYPACATAQSHLYYYYYYYYYFHIFIFALWTFLPRRLTLSSRTAQIATSSCYCPSSSTSPAVAGPARRLLRPRPSSGSTRSREGKGATPASDCPRSSACRHRTGNRSRCSPKADSKAAVTTRP